MRHNPAPSAQSFVGFGLLMVAWRFAPGPQSDPMLYVLSGMFAFCGAIMPDLPCKPRTRRRP